MPELPTTIYIYSLLLVINLSMAAFLLVVMVLSRFRAPTTSIKIFRLYFLVGCAGWITEGLRILGILKTYNQQIGIGYVLTGLLLLLAVAEGFMNRASTLALVLLHGLAIYLLLDSEQLSSKLFVVSVYALSIYGLISFLSLRRGLRSSNIGYLIIGFTSFGVFASAIYQLYAMVILGDAISAYTAVFMSSSIGFVLIGIGFLTSILIVEHQNLSALALNDPLTGLCNRRGLHRAIPSLIDAAMRKKECISLVTIDIDHFKRINDTYGHNEGDKVLKHVATSMKGFARSSDVLCRLGGEEFLLVLSNTRPDAAVAIAERCRKGVEKLMLICGGQPVSVTISLGVATQCDNLNFNRLIKDADAAMYQAKSEGRNRVAVRPAPVFSTQNE
jgi:diguanylate cyclase (GGDEF)-like protein